MPELRINDFTGGETDSYRDGNPKFCQRAFNMYFTDQKGMRPREGFGPLGPSDQRPFGSQRIDKVWHHRISRQTLSGSFNRARTFETFISSNRAVRRNDQENPGWEVVETTTGENRAQFVTRYQGNYVRLNQNEFILISSLYYPLKFYRESSVGEWKYVSLGLPKYRLNLSSTYNPGGNNWTYALVLKADYNLYDQGISLSIDKIVRSAPVFYEALSNDGIVQINIPTFSNATLANYTDNQSRIVSGEAFFDYSNIVWEIYRTVDDGNIFFKIGEAATNGGTPTYLDNDLDSAIVSGELLYTTGGVQPNEMVNSRIEYATFANDTLWLASTAAVWQAKVGIPDANPGSFNMTIREGEYVTGIETLDIYPILFTDKGVYRIEGIVDDSGNGTHRLRTVSEEYGALSNKTTIKANNKILFLSTDGIYETNGFTARKVTGHYDERYLDLVDVRALDESNVELYGYAIADACYDEKNQRAHWFFPNEGGKYLRKVLTLHLNYPHEEGYAITSGSVSHDVTSVSAIDGDIYFTSLDGSVLKQDSNRTYDFPISAGGANVPIAWNWYSSVMSFGTSMKRKWFTRLLLGVKPLIGSTFSFSIASARDESDDFRLLNPVDETGITSKIKFLKRWFTKGTLRSSTRQLYISGDTANTAQRPEISEITIMFNAPGEGHTESGVEP